MGNKRKTEAQIKSEDDRKKIMDLGQWVPIPRPMCAAIGTIEAIVLMTHFDFQVNKSDKYNHSIRKTIENEHGIARRQQKQIESKLIEFGFLSIIQNQYKNKTKYSVNTMNVVRFCKCLKEYGPPFVHKCRLAGKVPVDHKEYKATVKMCDGGAHSECDGGAHIKDTEQNNTEQNNKLFCKGFDKPSSVGTKKSRLMDKGNIPEEYIAPKSSLADRTNNTVQQNKRAAIAIPERTRQCIEYWNKFPELVEHRITPDNPTKTLEHIVKLIGSFLAGNFLDVVTIPRGFEDHAWFNRKPSVDDFCDIVDEFIDCLRNPSLKPTMNGSRVNLLTFLNGNKYGENGGIESLMLIYCFGELKTVMVDKFPDTTKLIKDIWAKYVGKYKPTAETETAYIVASKLCHMRYNEKREEEDGWIPAMNDYRPEGIVRQILINKSEFFKEKRIQPDLMGNSWFGSLIRRYDYDRKTGSMVL